MLELTEGKKLLKPTLRHHKEIEIDKGKMLVRRRYLHPYK